MYSCSLSDDLLFQDLLGLHRVSCELVQFSIIQPIVRNFKLPFDLILHCLFEIRLNLLTLFQYISENCSHWPIMGLFCACLRFVLILLFTLRYVLSHSLKDLLYIGLQSLALSHQRRYFILHLFLFARRLLIQHQFLNQLFHLLVFHLHLRKVLQQRLTMWQELLHQFPIIVLFYISFNRLKWDTLIPSHTL